MPKHLKRILIEILAVAILIAFYFASPLKLTDDHKHLLLILIAILAVHLVDHIFLWAEALKWHEQAVQRAVERSHAITLSAAACGLTEIFPSRRASKLDSDIRKHIDGASKRLWFLGVALSEEISLKELLEQLDAKTDSTDIKILLLDSYRSPAVFRTMLEIPLKKLAEIVGMRGFRSPNPDRLRSERLFSDLKVLYDRIGNYPKLKQCIRFYAHTPSCWLVIADEDAYLQPYTFGRNPRQRPEELSLGPHMPVFHFQRQSNGNVLEILEDHFKRLWSTSDVDYFHFGARIVRGEEILNVMFQNRSAWFRHVYSALNHENRVHPRQPCSSDTRITIRYQGRPAVEAKVINASYDSVAVIMDAGSPLPLKDTRASIARVSRQEAPEAVYMVDGLLTPGADFTVMRVDPQRHLVALRREAKVPREEYHTAGVGG